MIARHLPTLLTALTLIGCATALQAQTLDDALRFSEVFPLGTARSLGTANSMSALGADWTATAANPAGIAAFRRNEISITGAGIITGSNNPIFDGQASSGAQTETNIALPQLGLVLTREPIGSKWRQINFGVGVSQSNRFEENLGFAGESSGSITDLWLDQANRYALDSQGRRAFVDVGNPNGEFDFVYNPLSLPELGDFDTGLAFDAGVLVPGDDTDAPERYISDYDDARSDVFNAGPRLTKQGTFARSGRNAAIDLTFGANYDERFLFGATLALSRLRYENTTNYRESDDANVAGAFSSLAYNTFATVTATGVQLRLGGIYRASQALRLGLAYHSPSFLNVEDSFDNYLFYEYEDESGNLQSGDTRPAGASVIEYNFRSPSQYKASVAGLLGKRGFLSAELTYLNYAGARYNTDSGDEGAASSAVVDDSNAAIGDFLTSAVQFRVGGEANLAPLKLRAGFQYIGAPIEDEDAVLGFNAGVGFRQNRLGLDLGYQTLLRPDRLYRPYNIEPLNFPEPLATYSPVSHTLALTVGWKLVSL